MDSVFKTELPVKIKYDCVYQIDQVQHGPRQVW